MPWKYVTESGLEGDEFDTMQDAYRAAEVRFWEQCSDNGVREAREEIILTEFEWNNNDEPRDIQERTDYLEYEYYEGDAKHHSIGG